MKIETIDIEQWRQEAPGLRARNEKILARFKPAQRQKPRTASEADFLRRIGTPERLIGPTE